MTNNDDSFFFRSFLFDNAIYISNRDKIILECEISEIPSTKKIFLLFFFRDDEFELKLNK